MSSKCIAVFGDLLYDCFIWADRLPRTGETVIGYDSAFLASGKGGNQAATCAMLGVETLMLGKVGYDQRGDFLLDMMRSTGMNVDGVIRSTEFPTGTDCVMVARDGHNAIIVAPNATAHIKLNEVEAMRPAFERADVVMLQLLVNRDAVKRAMQLAKQCGCKVLLNPAPACEIDDEFFALADVITPNETESEFFTGIMQDSMPLPEWCRATAKSFHARGARNIIITLGENGAYYSGEEGEVLMPAFKIDAVDSTAAGDAFSGGIAVKMAENANIHEALEYASACGAITATRPGSLPSLPCADEVEAFIKNYHTMGRE